MSEYPFWKSSLKSLLKHYNTSSEGLTKRQASIRLKRYGPNQLHPPKKNAILLQLLSKFGNPLVIILLVASSISAFTGDLTNFIIISLIILFSIALDFFQEYKAGKEVESLRQSVTVRVKTLRDGLLPYPCIQLISESL